MSRSINRILCLYLILPFVLCVFCSELVGHIFVWRSNNGLSSCMDRSGSVHGQVRCFSGPKSEKGYASCRSARVVSSCFRRAAATVWTGCERILSRKNLILLFRLYLTVVICENVDMRKFHVKKKKKKKSNTSNMLC